jgi:cytochrome b
LIGVNTPANGTLLLIVFHVLGVGFTSVARKENLVRAMFSGRKCPL